MLESEQLIEQDAKRKRGRRCSLSLKDRPGREHIHESSRRRYSQHLEARHEERLAQAIADHDYNAPENQPPTSILSNDGAPKGAAAGSSGMPDRKTLPTPQARAPSPEDALSA